jgi:hypothetical protein
LTETTDRRFFDSPSWDRSWGRLIRLSDGSRLSPSSVDFRFCRWTQYLFIFCCFVFADIFLIVVFFADILINIYFWRVIIKRLWWEWDEKWIKMRWNVNQDEIRYESKWDKMWVKIRWVLSKKEKKYEIKNNETCREEIRRKK